MGCPPCGRSALSLLLCLSLSVFTAHADVTDVWPYTTTLTASSGEMVNWGNTISAYLLNLLARPAEDSLEVINMYKLGVFRHNESSLARDAEEKLLKRYYHSKINARNNHLTAWYGIAFQLDGTSMWTYPQNNSGYSIPNTYKGNVTSGLVYESTKYFGKLKKGPIESYYYNTDGELIAPSFSSYAYEPRTRPWYVAGLKYGTHWGSDFFDWLGNTYVSLQAVAYDRIGSLVGITNCFFSVGLLEKRMRAVSGAETEESIVFVMESNGGELVLTSLPGNTLASDGITQIVATESNVTFIRETAQLLLDMSPDAASMQFAVPNVNPFLYKGYWVEVKAYSSIGGITLQSPWLMVLAKQACGETYFFKEEVNSPEGNIAAANSLGDCEPCPGRSTCPGGLALPIVKEGYWQEASAVIHLSKRPLRCDPVTACTGGSRVSECFESAATLEVCGQSSSFATAFSTRSPNAPAAATGVSRGLCRGGHSGVMCEVCINNYYKNNDGFCHLCSSVNTTIALCSVFGVLAIIVGTILLLLHSESTESSFGGWFKQRILHNFDMATFKVLWPSLQILSTIPWNLNSTFPEPFSSLNKWLRFTQLTLNDILPMECLFGYRFDHFHNLVFSTLIPICLSAMLLLIAGVQAKLSERQRRRMRDPAVLIREFATIQGSSSTYEDVSRHVDCFGLFLLLTFIVLPTVSMTIVRLRPKKNLLLLPLHRKLILII